MVYVVEDRGVWCQRRQDEDVHIGRHAGSGRLLDVRGDVDGVRADRQIPDAVAGEGPSERVSLRIPVRSGGAGWRGRRGCGTIVMRDDSRYGEAAVDV